MRRLIGLVTAILALVAPVQAGANGALVIVGGGLSDDNDAVFGAFLDALPHPDAPIAIIPAASGYPAGSAASFAAALAKRGVAAERIRVVRLAVEDDPDTSEDESLWRGNSEDAAEIARLAGAGGIWFTGGDQARIVAALYRADGSESAMLVAIRTAHRKGAVIGGTSAGAAIMSRTMIVAGDPLSLLPGEGTSREAIVTGDGLGFLESGLVDQHFGERARLIRLLAALGGLPADRRIGFGIDEDTALIVAPDQSSARVAGRGWVTLVDARGAEHRAAPSFAMRGAAIAMVQPGELIDLARLTAPAARAQAFAPCLSATSTAGPSASQSQIFARMAGSLTPGMEATCLIAAGGRGLALRLYRRADAADARLMLDVVPVGLRLEPAAP